MGCEQDGRGSEGEKDEGSAARSTVEEVAIGFELKERGRDAEDRRFWMLPIPLAISWRGELGPLASELSVEIRIVRPPSSSSSELPPG
jgi:hypothetical protein